MPPRLRSIGQRPTPAQRLRGLAILALGVFVAALALLVVAAAHGCGAPQRTFDQNAHIAINTAAHGLRLSDNILSPLYQQARATDVAAAVQRFEGAARAESTALAVLQSLEHAAAIYAATNAAGDKCIMGVLAGSLKQALDDLLAAMRAAGVTVSPELISGAGLVGDLVAAIVPACSSPSPSPSPKAGAR
jgi:hypothetical protein